MTSVDLRKQLYNIQYRLNKEKATEFWDLFDEIVRNYKSHREKFTSDTSVGLLKHKFNW